MAKPSLAWLVVAVLTSLLISQNAELDFTTLACSQAAVQQFYDVLAFLSMGSIFLSDQGTLASIRKRCGTAASVDSALEIGFGDGVLAQMLLEDGVERYDGLELSEGMLNLTLRSSTLDLRRAQLIQNTEPLEQLESSPRLGSYMQAYALFVLDAMPETEVRRALKAFRGRLKNGGTLCLSFLADEPRWRVWLYKAAWRILPTLFGGQRPVRLRQLVQDEDWLVREESLDESSWLPVRVLLLEARERSGQAQEKLTPGTEAPHRDATLQRWASHLKEVTLEQGVGLRQRLGAASHELPAGVAKDVAHVWLPELSQGTLTALIKEDLARMTREEILADFENSLNLTSGAQLQQEMKAVIVSSDTATLEQWISPPAEGFSTEELRARIVWDLDGAIQNSGHDAALLSSLLRHREAAESLQTRVELMELRDTLFREVFRPPSDMSRSELEQLAVEATEQMSAEEMRENVLANYEAHTDDELRSGMLEALALVRRRDLEERVLAALQYLDASSLQPAVQEVAEKLVSDDELGILMSTQSHEFTLNRDKHNEL